ncbi:MAG: accessory gene regulator B family protein [Bacilli bacterium]|nr:accessory gene regulator B family protein [Bacilli bacterium]
MKKQFLNFCEKTIIKNNKNINEEELEIINYGLESIYLTLVKIVIIIFLSLLLGIFKEVILMIVSYNIIRFFAFGLHAPNSTSCLITSIILFIGGAYVSVYLDISIYIKIIISFISILLISIYAPADTEKRPLINRKKRMKYKYISIVVSIFMSFFLIKFHDSYLSNFLLIGLIEEVIMILPITYKLYKLPYNNYKTYNEV